MKESTIAISERELRRLLDRMDYAALDQAACRGLSPDVYHPDEGTPDSADLRRCVTCPARTPCLALALRAEDPEARCGWYGGLGPEERAALVESLRLEQNQQPETDPAVEAVRLFNEGWIINDIAAKFDRSRRTIQRWLRKAA